MALKETPPLSICVFIAKEEKSLSTIIIDDYYHKLKVIGGELILCGSLDNIKSPEGVLLIQSELGRPPMQKAGIKNLAVSHSRGRTIIISDGAALIGPANWPKNLIEWAEMINESVAYIFGLKVISPNGDRLSDWISLEVENHSALYDYGEHCQNLAIGGGLIGMSRPAWEISGGFRENSMGLEENIEFTIRASKEKKIPIVFCDALYAVRVDTTRQRNLSKD
jgi:hypothetical protein